MSDTDVTLCLAGRQAGSGERVPPEFRRARLRADALPDLSKRLPRIVSADPDGSNAAPLACPAEAGRPVRAVLFAHRVVACPTTPRRA